VMRDASRHRRRRLLAEIQVRPSCRRAHPSNRKGATPPASGRPARSAVHNLRPSGCLLAVSNLSQELRCNLGINDELEDIADLAVRRLRGAIRAPAEAGLRRLLAAYCEPAWISR
jgi:hypothetical protein